jgi:flagellar hook-basal body complex protein FliE
MPTQILPFTPILPPVASAILNPVDESTSGPAFAAAFSDAVNKVESFQSNAQQSINRFLNGEGEEIHKVALASQQADLTFQLFLQVRNKVVSAYQEIMRMQV